MTISLWALAAVGGPAHACDIRSATDITCGSLSVNPANPNSLNNPANPNSPQNILNPANPLSPNNPNNPSNPNNLNNPANPNSPLNINNPANPSSLDNPNNPASPLNRNRQDELRHEAEIRYRHEVLGEPYLKNGALGLFEGDHPTVSYGGIGHERECRLGIDCPRSVYTPDLMLATGQRPEAAPSPPPASRRKRHRSAR